MKLFSFNSAHHNLVASLSSLNPPIPQEECPGKPYSDRLMQYSLRATLSYEDLEATVLYKLDKRRAPLNMLISHMYPNGDRVVFAFDGSFKCVGF